MSALDHKRTFAVQNVMSAFPQIADMCSATSDVRFVPIADIASFFERARLPDGKGGRGSCWLGRGGA
jgi:hypothetical protein